MTDRPTDGGLSERVRALVEPIASDLALDLYDVEQRGGTLRVTLDTPPGSEGGINLDTLALATRLVSRELDEVDPLPGRYTLEVTSPGVERTLRTPAHFAREIGKTVLIRLADVPAEQRRVEGVLVAADDRAATVRIEDAATAGPEDVTVEYARIDRARTVFVWGPSPKPGKAKKSGAQKSDAKSSSAKTSVAESYAEHEHAEKESS